MYAEVIVNHPRVSGTFHYHIPPDLAGKLEIGHLIEVPFGSSRAQGVILRFDTHTPHPATKPITRLIEARPVMNSAQLALALWLSQEYHSPAAASLSLFLPPGMSQHGDTLYRLAGEAEAVPENETQARVLKLLTERGPLRSRQIRRSLPKRSIDVALQRLAEHGLLTREPVLNAPALRDQELRYIELAIHPAEVEAAIEVHLSPQTASRRRAADRRADLLRRLAEAGGSLPGAVLLKGVEGATLSDLRWLAELDLLLLRQEHVWRDSLQGWHFTPQQPPELTSEQASAWALIAAQMDRPAPRPVLLHGVTGSGKTEFYLRAVEVALARGLGAIVLVPEIALTAQTIQRFGARFPGQLAIVHSELSDGERYDTWRRAREGLARVVIGPRSALFAPLPRLGVIVIDECHDDSYKNGPPIPPPYYHALPTALELARQNGALALLGSATPDIATFAASAPVEEPDAAAILRVSLPNRIMGHREAVQAGAQHYHVQSPYAHQAGDPDAAVMIDLPPVQVIDMRQELRAGNRSMFSRALQRTLRETLARGEQAILFLNRRGRSTHVFCRACGSVLRCPNDDSPLTWHSAANGDERSGRMVCHQCDYRAPHPEKCPHCGSDQIKFFGAGTQRIEEELAAQFPGTRALRWDRDTTLTPGAHFDLLGRFARREAQVLIGTQMVAKGLDLPLVTLVGVVSADTALYLPDYRAGERAFQLLTQVAGRAGRSLLGGQVILQTFAPDHYAVQAASRHDYMTFYQRELAYRQQLGYPPFTRLVRLLIRRETPDKAREEASRLHALLTERIAAAEAASASLIGPAPCFYPRAHGLYRWQVILRSPKPHALLEDLHNNDALTIDLDPVDLL